MSNRLLLTFFVLFLPISIPINAINQLDQVSQELESCMNEDFDNPGTIRSGKVDKDYDAICDQSPIKASPRWQQWLSNIGGTIMLRTVLFKRFVARNYTELKNKISLLWYGKQKTNLS